MAGGMHQIEQHNGAIDGPGFCRAGVGEAGPGGNSGRAEKMLSAGAAKERTWTAEPRS